MFSMGYRVGCILPPRTVEVQPLLGPYIICHNMKLAKSDLLELPVCCRDHTGPVSGTTAKTFNKSAFIKPCEVYCY